MALIESDESLRDVLSYDLFGTFRDPSRLLQYASCDVVRVITLPEPVRGAKSEKLASGTKSAELPCFGRDELARLDAVKRHRQMAEAYQSGRDVALE